MRLSKIVVPSGRLATNVKTPTSDTPSPPPLFRLHGRAAVVLSLPSPQILQMYASQEILLGSSSGSSSSSDPSTTAGQGFGGDSAPSPGTSAAAAAAAAEKGGGDAEPDAGTPRKRTPAQLLLDEIMVTDADKWDGVLAGLAAPGSMTGGVTKEGLLGAIQASDENGFACVLIARRGFV